MALVLDVDQVTRLREVFDMHLEAGLHPGAQLAVYRDGTQVVDVAGGRTGPTGEPTTTDTPHLLLSGGTPFIAVCIHRLVEDGDLAYDEPVVSYWPSFADAGTEKASITVRHVLSHQAGVPSSEFDRRHADWGDPEAAAAAMADLDLQFTPGTDAAVHTLTDGWILGELVRRVTGSSVAAYARQTVFDPLDMADTGFGKPADEALPNLVGFRETDRCGCPEPGRPAIPPMRVAELFNRDAVQEAVVPAATAVSTARDLARFYACIANDGALDGTRILDARTVERARTLQVEVDSDGTVGLPRRYALGFERGGLPEDAFGTLGPRQVVGHSGLGASVAWADPAADLAMAYVTNGVRGVADHRRRANAMADAVRAVFDTR